MRVKSNLTDLIVEAAAGSELYHTTNYNSLKSILSSMKLTPGPRGRVSISEWPFFESATLGWGEGPVIVLDKQKIKRHLMQVRYTPDWCRRNLEQCKHISSSAGSPEWDAPRLPSLNTIRKTNRALITRSAHKRGGEEDNWIDSTGLDVLDKIRAAGLGDCIITGVDPVTKKEFPIKVDEKCFSRADAEIQGTRAWKGFSRFQNYKSEREWLTRNANFALPIKGAIKRIIIPKSRSQMFSGVATLAAKFGIPVAVQRDRGVEDSIKRYARTALKAFRNDPLSALIGNRKYGDQLLNNIGKGLAVAWDAVPGIMGQFAADELTLPPALFRGKMPGKISSGQDMYEALGATLLSLAGVTQSTFAKRFGVKEEVSDALVLKTVKTFFNVVRSPENYLLKPTRSNSGSVSQLYLKYSEIFEDGGAQEIWVAAVAGMGGRRADWVPKRLQSRWESASGVPFDDLTRVRFHPGSNLRNVRKLWDTALGLITKKLIQDFDPVKVLQAITGRQSQLKLKQDLFSWLYDIFKGKRLTQLHELAIRGITAQSFDRATLDPSNPDARKYWDENYASFLEEVERGSTGMAWNSLMTRAMAEEKSSFTAEFHTPVPVARIAFLSSTEVKSLIERLASSEQTWKSYLKKIDTTKIFTKSIVNIADQEFSRALESIRRSPSPEKFLATMESYKPSSEFRPKPNKQHALIQSYLWGSYVGSAAFKDWEKNLAEFGYDDLRNLFRSNDVKELLDDYYLEVQKSFNALKAKHYKKNISILSGILKPGGNAAMQTFIRNFAEYIETGSWEGRPTGTSSVNLMIRNLRFWVQDEDKLMRTRREINSAFAYLGRKVTGPTNKVNITADLVKKWLGSSAQWFDLGWFSRSERNKVVGPAQGSSKSGGFDYTVYVDINERDAEPGSLGFMQLDIDFDNNRVRVGESVTGPLSSLPKFAKDFAQKRIASVKAERAKKDALDDILF